VRDLARNMVQDVSLRNTVGGMCADPGHKGTQITEEVTVQGGKGAAGKGELGGTIMREKRVGVLQEGDQDKPVVDPKVRHQVNLPDSGEALDVDAGGDNGKPDGDTHN